MSYVKTDWETGDIITAEKLNNLETGVGDSLQVLIVNLNFDEATGTPSIDKSCEEIYNALQANKVVLLRNGDFLTTLTGGMSDIEYTFHGTYTSINFGGLGQGETPFADFSKEDCYIAENLTTHEVTITDTFKEYHWNVTDVTE